MTNENEPRQKREFTDFSDMPQNGYGVLDADRELLDPKEEDEGIPLENDSDDIWEGHGERFD